VTTLLNQANCREQNHQLVTAWGLFLEAARLAGAATDKASRQMHQVATDRAAKLEPRLSTLRVTVPAGHRVAGLEVRRDGAPLDPATWNQALPIDGGSYTISARAPGHAEWSGTVAVAAERAVTAIEIPKLGAAGASGGTVEREDQRGNAGQAQGDVSRAVTPADDAPVWSGKRKLALGIAGGGVVALAVGGLLGTSAKRKQDDAHALCADPQIACDEADRANELIESGHNRAIGANVAFGIGAAALIGGGLLWVTGAPERRRQVAIEPVVSPEQVVITAVGRF
jgi:hypothetical protein